MQLLSGRAFGSRFRGQRVDLLTFCVQGANSAQAKALLNNKSNCCTCTQIPYSENKGIIEVCVARDVFAPEHGLYMVLILVFVFIKN